MDTNRTPPAPADSVSRPAATDLEGSYFTEVARSAGLDETQSDLGFNGSFTQGAPASVADVDGDGDLDVFLPRSGKPNGLYLNDGFGHFTDMASEAGVAGPSSRFGSGPSAFLDIEGDGDLDLFASGTGAGRDQLFVNDGTAHFTGEASRRGLDRPVMPDTSHTQQHGVAVADVDNDGDMDLLVLQWRSSIHNPDAFVAASRLMGWPRSYAPPPCETYSAIAAAGYPEPPDPEPSRSALYLNDGSGHFSDVTDDFGLDLHNVVALTPVFQDFDSDGWVDLAATGDGCSSRLYRNRAGSGFVDITDSATLGTDENGMGSAVRDIDGNGTPDWLITSIFRDTSDGEPCEGGTFFACSGNRVFLNDGSASFVDATDELRLRDTGWGWGVAVEDFDNDGDLEVVATNGYRLADEPDPSATFHLPFHDDPTAYFSRVDTAAGSPYSEMSDRVGITDTGQGQALVPFDADNDGDLDILIAQSNDVPLLYRNDSPPQNSWIEVSLVDPGTPGNRWGDGSRVVIEPDPGVKRLFDWVSTSGSYESQRPPRIHRGFGERTEPLARIEITWPGAKQAQVVEQVELNQHLVIVREATTS